MDFDEEYGTKSNLPQRRRRRLLFLGFLVGTCLVVLLLLRSSVHRQSAGAAVSEKLFSTSPLDWKNVSIKVEDTVSFKYYAKAFNGTFVNDTTIKYYNEDGDLVIYDIPARNIKLVLSGLEFLKYIASAPATIEFSPTNRYILVSYDPQKIYRHSSVAFYNVIDLETRNSLRISTEAYQGDSEQSRRLQICKWAKNTDSLVFVHFNDIYFLSDINSNNVKRITYSGRHSVFNGVTDWLYEEEVFSDNIAVWAYDNSTMAYVSFNDTKVQLINFPYYGNLQYPVIEGIPYPKTGTTNPTTTLNIYRNGVTTPVKFPPHIPSEHYIASVKWTHDEKLLVNILNRVQNTSWILLCTEDICDAVHSRESPYWLDITSLVEYTPNSFVTIESTKQVQRTYHHIVEIGRNSVVKVLTSGNYSVDSIIAVTSNGEIFYTVTPEQNLYKYDGTRSYCISCSFQCTYNKIDSYSTIYLQSELPYFVHTCHKGLREVPKVLLHETKTGKLIGVFEGNEKLESSLKYARLPTKKRLTYVKDGFEYNMDILIPHDFDENQKYAFLLDVYGGPGTTKLRDMFTIDWGVSLVSSKNVIYGMMDARGSGSASDDFMFSVYRRLGTIEIQDYIDMVKWLVNTQSYIDKDKVGIWGWSYGGFVASMGLATGNGVFKCGIAVAPVTNWLFYDTAYTERYMSLPADNPTGYNNSDVTNYVEGFRFKKFLLVHGSGDDNVHYQNSMILARALEEKDIPFFQQTYTDENHSIGRFRLHLYHAFENFLFNNCF